MPPKQKKRSAKSTDLLVTEKQLLKLKLAYDEQCRQSKTVPHPYVYSTIRAHIQEPKALAKLVFVGDKAATNGTNTNYQLTQLIGACRNVRYVHFREIYIWDYNIIIEEISALEDFLRQPAYVVKYLEIFDCNLNPFLLRRLVRSFQSVTLSSLLLDYNNFGDEGVEHLCSALTGNVTLTGLSLNYCGVSAASSQALGKLIATTAIKELYLDGNNIGCDGLNNLITLIADKAEMENLSKKKGAGISLADHSNKLLLATKTAVMAAQSKMSGPAVQKSVSRKGKKKKGKGKKQEGDATPKVGPYLEKLHVVNNGIDGYSAGKSYAPVICMRHLRKWISNSDDVKELDLEDNSIGDLAAREVLAGLEERKENGLSPVKVCVTQCISSEVFTKIFTLGSGKTERKRKKGKGKPGKKKI